MIEILTLLPYYLPGHTSGGPIRTIANFVDRLGDEFRIKIITSHSDPRDRAAYRGVPVNTFVPVGKARVYYATPDRLSMNGLRLLLSTEIYDVLYLNSFFSSCFTVKPLLLRRLGLAPRRPVVIAPRGEFSPGALALKATKKRLYFSFARFAKLYDRASWLATTSHEREDILRLLGDVRIGIAPNLVSTSSRKVVRRQKKREAHLNLVFLSRLARKKNLDGALRLLRGVRGSLSLDIYGAHEDPAYWIECSRLIEALPASIQVSYRGPVKHELVPSLLARYDFLILPTHGENFGHVILEAMLAGCPVLISDCTPWKNLAAQRAGWDLPLEKTAAWQHVLEFCVNMTSDEHGRWSTGAIEYADTVVNDPCAIGKNRELFILAASRARADC